MEINCGHQFASQVHSDFTDDGQLECKYCFYVCVCTMASSKSSTHIFLPPSNGSLARLSTSFVTETAALTLNVTAVQLMRLTRYKTDFSEA